MLVGIREWTFEGREGCVAMRLRSRELRAADAAGDRLAVEVSVELTARGRFRGGCLVALPAAELVRFQSELDALLAGQRPCATLGGMGDDLALTLDTVPGGARLSGFLGTGVAGALSFNDLELDGPTMRRSQLMLGRVVRELQR